jgi:hypothetical protein
MRALSFSLPLFIGVGLAAACNVYDPSLLEGDTGGASAAGGNGSTSGAGGSSANTGVGGNAGGSANGGNSASPGGGSSGDAPGGTSGTSGTSGTGGTGGMGKPLSLIDDFEAGLARIEPHDGRTGFWYPFERYDNSKVTFANKLIDDRPGSRRAANITTGGVDTFGGFGADLKNKAEYDASKYKGIEFWAKLVSDAAATTMRLTIADDTTYPGAGVCEERNAELECFNDWSTPLSFDEDNVWKHFAIRWTDLSQEPWGSRADALHADKMYNVQFKFGPGQVVDMWIDDVSFLTE